MTELIIFAGNLTVHKQHSHEGLKRYSCDLCPFKSNSVFSLKNHAVLKHDLKVKLVSMGLNHIGTIVWFFPLTGMNIVFKSRQLHAGLVFPKSGFFPLFHLTNMYSLYKYLAKMMLLRENLPFMAEFFNTRHRFGKIFKIKLFCY